MMRILFAAARLSYGGLEAVIGNLARGLAHRGTQVCVFASAIESEWKRTFPDVEARGLMTSSPSHYATQLNQAVVSFRPSIVVSTANDVALYALASCKLSARKSRLVVTQHLSISEPIRRASSFRERARLILMKEMLRIAVRHANSCVGVSTEVTRELRELGAPPSSLFTIHNPVIGDDIHRRLATQPPWPWPDQARPTILFVGRLAAAKRLDLLIDAFSRVVALRECRLLVLGDGPLEAVHRADVAARGIDQHVRFMGRVDDPVGYMTRCRALVLTSDFEGFGNVIVEGLSAGLPIIATDCPSGPAEILENGRFGSLVPVGDPEAIAQAILATLEGRAVSSPEARRERAGKFSINATVIAYERLFQHLSNSA